MPKARWSSRFYDKRGRYFYVLAMLSPHDVPSRRDLLDKALVDANQALTCLWEDIESRRVLLEHREQVEQAINAGGALHTHDDPVLDEPSGAPRAQ